MYLGYGGRIPWWRWVLVVLALPWYGIGRIWRALFPRGDQDADHRTGGSLEPGSEIFQRLLSLEAELANEVFRDTPEVVQERIHPEFVEVGSSGALVDRDMAIRWILDRFERGGTELGEASVSGLGGGWYLVRYRARSASGRSSRRMSLWRQEPSGALRIRYHQGTPVQESVQRAP